MDVWNIFSGEWVPFGEWVEVALDWLVGNFRFVFQATKVPFDFVLEVFERTLSSTPDILVLVVVVLVGWRAGGWPVGLVAFVSLTAIGLVGAWDASMVTLSIVLTCVIFCCVVGIPLGIAAARNDWLWVLLRPVLDLMQTIPSFVYLVPVVMLFSIGNVSGVIVTFIYALPPVVRLTNLGIRQVPEDMVEAAEAFGASRWDTLRKVELPLAMPTIVTGVGQTVMMSLSMVVVSSMISVGGLGQMVLRGIGRMDMGLATIGGVGVVLLAVVIDRIVQGFASPARKRGPGF